MPKIINERIEMVRVSLLKMHPRNCRQGDIGAVYTSIVTNGFYGTLVVQVGTCYILAGNHRFMAALQAGFEELPVTWVDVDDNEALRILLADNRTSDLADYDQKRLAELLAELQNGTDEQLVGTGYDEDDLDKLIRDIANSSATGTDEEPKRKGEDRLAIVLICQDEGEQDMLNDKLSSMGYYPRKTILNERTQLAIG